MATLTAASGGGNWSAPSTWIPAQVPTAADSCIINSTMTGTVTIDGSDTHPNLCHSLNCTGCTHTLNHLGRLDVGNNVAGAFTLATGMTYNAGGNLNFVSTVAGNTITSAGKTLSFVTFNGAGGGWTLQDNLTISEIFLELGTLNAGSHSVSIGQFVGTYTSGARALIMSGTWTVGGWQILDSTAMTLTATGSTIIYSGGAFQAGSLTYGTLNLVAGTSPTIYGSNTFSNIIYTCGAFPTDSISFAGNQTVTTRLTINGNSLLNRILIRSDIKGATRTLTTAANTISYADLQDIAGAGAGSWNLSAITGNSGNCGGCSGITFTSAINCYMKTGVAVSWSGSNWYTTSGGSTHSRLPLPQDMAIFDANSITAHINITIDVPRICGMDWTGVLNTPSLTNTTTSVFGEVIFSSGMSGFGGGTMFTFENRSSINFDSGGLTWLLGTIVQNGPGGTINQVSDFYSDNLVHMSGGTWSNGIHTFEPSDGLIIDGGTFNLGSGTVTCDGGFTLSAGLLEMNGNNISVPISNPSITGVNISGGILNLSGQISNFFSDTSVSGGIINDTGLAGELQGWTVEFTGGTSVIRTLTIATTFSQSSISSLTITGGATWSDKWTWTGTDYTFTTAGVATWSQSSAPGNPGILTIVANGGSWTFC